MTERSIEDNLQEHRLAKLEDFIEEPRRPGVNFLDLAAPPEVVTLPPFVK
jgi:hypothetical protein